MDSSLPGSSVHGISQTGIMEWLPFPSPGDLPDPGIKAMSPAFAGGFFTTEPLAKLYWEKEESEKKFTGLCGYSLSTSVLRAHIY